MTTKQYIGARYVPLIIGEWDNSISYEPLSIVTYEGDSYTSKQSVPIGVSISNEDYWVCTGNYNAQVEYYRQQAVAIENKIPASDFDSENTVKKYIDDSITEVNGTISDLSDIIPSDSFDSENTVKKYVDDSISDFGDIVPADSFDSENTVKKYIDDSISNVADIIPSTDFTSEDTVKDYIIKNSPFITPEWEYLGTLQLLDNTYFQAATCYNDVIYATHSTIGTRQKAYISQFDISDLTFISRTEIDDKDTNGGYDCQM